MVSILDASAVLHIPLVASDPPGVYSWLQEELRVGRAAIPSVACAEVDHFATEDGLAAVFIAGARNDRAYTDAAIEYQHYVSHQIGDALVEPDVENGRFYVVALAHEIHVAEKNAIVVVTEDVTDTTYLSLRSACHRLGFPEIRVRPWLQANGHAVKS